MTLRKGKLFRKCQRCEEMFLPTGRCNYICKKCNKNNKDKGWLDEIIKMQNKPKCKYLKSPPGGYKICTNKFNYDFRSRKKGRATAPKRCLTKYCPLDIK